MLSLFEPCAKLYAQLLLVAESTRAHSPADVAQQLRQCEGELAWLVYIIGTVLGSHQQPSSHSEAQQAVDAELTCTVLKLLAILDAPHTLHQRRGHRSNEHLELALALFMQQFRKVYVGDQATASSKVYMVLHERLNLPDHLAVVSVLMHKIVTNLKMRSECLDVTEKTLALLADLAGGYSSGKLLLKLELVHFMLGHHGASEFPFLDVTANVRLRTSYYSTLCKLLFSSENTVKFRDFMRPFTEQFIWLRDRIGSEQAVSSAELRATLIGLLRDLRGVVSACSSRRTYTYFFEWIYPEFTLVMQRAAAIYHTVPAVSTPLLKLYAELVYNKGQRLTFDSSSPNGILLFRPPPQVVEFQFHEISHPRLHVSLLVNPPDARALLCPCITILCMHPALGAPYLPLLGTPLRSLSRMALVCSTSKYQWARMFTHKGTRGSRCACCCLRARSRATTSTSASLRFTATARSQTASMLPSSSVYACR